MKRKLGTLRQVCQRLNPFQEILFHPAELFVPYVIGRIRTVKQLRKASLHLNPVKLLRFFRLYRFFLLIFSRGRLPASVIGLLGFLRKLLAGNEHGDLGIFLRTAQGTFLFFPVVPILKLHRAVCELLIKLVQPPSEEI